MSILRLSIPLLCSASLFALVVSVPQAWAADPPAEAAEETAQEPAEEAPAEPAKLFPDAGLEAAVRAEVFEKRYNQEPITKEDVQNISRVVGKGKGIKSLEGLQHCPALMLIDLSENEISDLKPIAELERLQSVTLANNKIEDISPLQNLTAMQLLDLSGNQVASLDALGKMSNLRSLWLADNKIQSLEPIAALSKIWSLDLAGNGLKEIGPIGKLTWLTNLDLDRNEIESVEALTPLTELDLLMLRDNKLQDLTPLVEMCRKDAEGPKRFAPYLRLYLKGNPLSEAARGEQLEQLRQLGVRVVMEEQEEAAK